LKYAGQPKTQDESAQDTGYSDNTETLKHDQHSHGVFSCIFVGIGVNRSLPLSRALQLLTLASASSFDANINALLPGTIGDLQSKRRVGAQFLDLGDTEPLVIG
jgi:hypothetical protein